MAFAWRGLARFRARDADELPGRGHDEKHAAVLAPPVGVDPVVGLLFAYVLEGFVSATRHGGDVRATGFTFFRPDPPGAEVA